MNKTTVIENPFVPGVGESPPYMGKRPEVVAALDVVLTALQRPHPPRPCYICMHGPRGNGKTVQLTAFEKQVGDAGIRTIILEPDNLQSDDTLVSALVKELGDADKTVWRALKELNLTSETSTNVEIMKSPVGRSESNRADDVRRALQAAKSSLLITLDEAHVDEVRPTTLKTQ